MTERNNCKRNKIIYNVSLVCFKCLEIDFTANVTPLAYQPPATAVVCSPPVHQCLGGQVCPLPSSVWPWDFLGRGLFLILHVIGLGDRDGVPVPCVGV